MKIQIRKGENHKSSIYSKVPIATTKISIKQEQSSVEEC